MVPARLNVVTLGARDLPRLRRFYAALGWEVAIDTEDFCAFRLGGLFLGLFPWAKLASDGQAQAAPPVDGMRGFSLGIIVERPEEVDRDHHRGREGRRRRHQATRRPGRVRGPQRLLRRPGGELLGGRLSEERRS